VPWTFLGAVALFVLALLFFLAETLLATHVLRFGRNLQRGRNATSR
jgi:predicted ABC-type sugar transport system permease subunit